MKSIEISPVGNLLVYKKNYKEDFIRQIIEERKLKGLRIFAILKEDRLDDISFLSKYNFLEELEIISATDFDFSFLNALINLKSLSISLEGKRTIDLSSLINLENLTIDWRKGNIKGLEHCKNLKKICLSQFNEKNLLPISILENLEELIIKTSTIITLEGIEKLTNLKKVVLGYCTRLKSIDKLSSLTSQKELVIDLCTKIVDYSPIGGMLSLEYLEFTNCKSVNTIKFIENLQKLHTFTLKGNTYIEDGNLIPAKNIKNLLYSHREHYNIKIINEEYDAIFKKNQSYIKEMFTKK